MRTPTRTELVEAHADKVAQIRQQAIAYRTQARAFTDLAAILEGTPSQGSIFDDARNELIEVAHDRAAYSTAVAEEADTQANYLESVGFEG